MNAADIMTEDPMTAGEDMTVGQALEILQTLEVRHLPVVSDSGELEGRVSDRDIRNSLTPFTLAPDPGRPTARITELMSTNLVTIGPETELSEIIDLMLENKVGALPVVDPTSGELLGIVSYVDVLRELRKAA